MSWIQTKKARLAEQQAHIQRLLRAAEEMKAQIAVLLSQK